ncbi:MAG: hypothetical protein IKZ96_03250 [Bacilli bacterium]|nr:hypothetical protein [Bacilli bacterium]
MRKPTWEEYYEYKKEVDKTFEEGKNNGKIRPYDPELIEDMREHYYNGIPLSISLLCNSMCRGRCNELALELARVFIDRGQRVGYFSFIVRGLKLRPDYYDENNPEYAQHGVLIVIEKDGSAWVYDTNLQLAMDFNMFIELEKPLEIGELLKGNLKECLKHLKDENPDSYKLDKEAAMAIIPVVEECYMLPRETDYINSYAGEYNDARLKTEIEFLKRSIGYRRELKKQKKGKK